MKLEEQQDLNLIPSTSSLQIDKDLTLLPRIKLNLTVHPSSLSTTLTAPIDEWKMKTALLTFLQTSHTLPFTLPEEDLVFKRFNKDLKKRKRDDPVVYGTLHIWNLSFLTDKNESEKVNDDVVVKWRNRLVEKMNGVELNLQGVKFRLDVVVPDCDDFDVMKKNWEEFYAFGKRNLNLRREPDTIVMSGVPSRWFAETRVSSKPSMLVTHTIFSKFGKIRCIFLKP
jgi:arginine/serine-rich splicing factor 17